MKFLFVAPRYHTNQIPIIKGLLESGHKVKFLVIYKGSTENYEELAPESIKYSFFTKLKYNRILSRKGEVKAENWLIHNFKPKITYIYRYLKEYEPDIVILRDRSKLSRIVYLICRLIGIKNVILYNQEPLNGEWLKSKLKKLLARIVFPKVRYTPVKYINLINKPNNNSIKEKNAYFIPFVQYIEDSSINRGYAKDDFIKILVVGKYREYKNLTILVDTLTHLTKYKNFHITVIGQVTNSIEQNYYENMNSLIMKNNVQNCITLLRNIPFNKMKEIYLQHDIFVLTSKREIASIAVLEAMANGLCIISTDNNGTAFYVTEGNAGLLFESDNSSDLASKIATLLDAPNLISQYGKNAINYIKNYCSFSNYYNALKQMLKAEFRLNLD